MSEPIAQVPVIRLNYAIKVGDKVGGADLVFETYVPQDAPLDHVHSIMDKLAAVATRQDAFAEIDYLRRDIEAGETQLQRMAHDMQQMETTLAEQWEKSNRRGAPKLTDAEAKAKTNMLNTISAVKQRIAQSKAKLDERMAQVEGG